MIKLDEMKKIPSIEIDPVIRLYTAKYRKDALHLRDGAGALCGIEAENLTENQDEVTCSPCMYSMFNAKLSKFNSLNEDAGIIE